jgi:hypothetical protein
LKAIERIASALRARHPVVGPTDVCAWVHGASWHHYWEHSLRKQPDLRTKAFKLWGAAENYPNALKRLQINGPPPPEPEIIAAKLLEASSFEAAPFLECGHRALTVGAVCAELGLETRYVTLFSTWHPTLVLTHHVLEIRGEHGWEFHDPDVGFCVPGEDGTPASLARIVADGAPCGYFEYGGGASLAYYIKRHFLLGYFDTAAVVDGDGQTLFLNARGASTRLKAGPHRGDPFSHHWLLRMIDPSFSAKIVKVKRTDSQPMAA